MMYNNEYRSWKTCPDVETNRDGDLRFKKGKERYQGGTLRRPEDFVKNSKGERRPVQWLIFKAFPDIPLRYAPESWKEDD